MYIKLLKEQIEYEKAYKEIITQEYDSRGNIISIEDTNNFSYFSGTNKSEYEYDAVNRLVKEEVTGDCTFTRRYSYDEEGNIKSIVTNDAETETFTYEQGRLTNIKTNGRIVSNFQYDLFGNPTHFKSATQNMWWEKRSKIGKNDRFCSFFM
ncbi:MAG: hypothetical protein J6B04_00880 [Clostridia bacterium]|nr:hypothetical protein [Clostridia bacterium]